MTTSRSTKPLVSRRPPCPRLARKALVEFREALEGMGYEEQPLSELLGLAHPLKLTREQRPAARARLRAVHGDPLLKLAARLWLLGDPVAASALDRHLGKRLVQALLRLQLIRRREEHYEATVSLYPIDKLWIATDRRFDPLVRQPVMYLGADSYTLAYLIPETRVERVLDLCTGSGVQAIMAARHAKWVLGVDTNPRAIAFARFNAALNRVEWRCHWLLADLDTAIAPEQRFDLILANPPFVPSPHTGSRALAYRDGGPRGDRVTRRLVSALGRRLRTNGLALIVSAIARWGEQTVLDHIERWLGTQTELDAIWLELGSERPQDYALAHSRRPFGDTEAKCTRRFERWHRSLVRAGIEAIEGGVLIVRPHRGLAPPWLKNYPIGTPLQPFRHLVEALVHGHEQAANVIFGDELLERAPKLAHTFELSCTMTQLFPERGLAPIEYTAQRHSMLLEPQLLDDACAKVLEHFRPGESLGALCEAAKVRPAEVIDDVLEMVRRALITFE